MAKSSRSGSPPPEKGVTPTAASKPPAPGAPGPAHDAAAPGLPPPTATPWAATRIRPAHVRIVAGNHRGRRLLAPPGETVRPTSDRAREALFNILSHGTLAAEGVPYAGVGVLDAFAGTGAIGLEALSRGA